MEKTAHMVATWLRDDSNRLRPGGVPFPGRVKRGASVLQYVPLTRYVMSPHPNYHNCRYRGPSPVAVRFRFIYFLRTRIDVYFRSPHL